MSFNNFESYSEAVKPVWRERRERSQAKRAETLARKKSELEESMAEQSILLSMHKAKERERDAALCAGLHGKDIRGLLTFLRKMTLDSAPALVRLIETAAWLPALNRQERVDLLSMVSRKIVSLRKRNGLTPFDDPMPDEPPNAYQQIKAAIAAGGAL